MKKNNIVFKAGFAIREAYLFGVTALFSILVTFGFNAYSQSNDWRNIENSLSIIPSEGYCDQPYAVINKRGEWVVVMTTGAHDEGQLGQHVISTISRDRGKTWLEPVSVEPSTGPEASWATILIVPSGRIYVFYTYNWENMRQVLDVNGNPIDRVDTFGKMMMKYSDDDGYSWSEKRYEVPIRNFEIDDNNIYKGKIQFFWSVANIIVHNDAVYLPFTKVGNFGEAFMVSGSGAILKSANILTETDPGKIVWETLPKGNKGLLPPKGLVADEHNIVSLNDSCLYCVYRTNQGHNVQAYSCDNGYTWTRPEWATYTPGGKIMKQPRCLNKIYKFSNGKYALFFHNNGGRYYNGHPFGNRNPTWLAGGIEKDGLMYWSQPEVFLYDVDHNQGISYPDWIEDNGEYFFTETQKYTARVHKIPNEFMEMLWEQAENNTLTTNGLVLELKDNSCLPNNNFKMPNLGRLFYGNGFSLELRLKTGTTKEDQVLIDTRREKTVGVNGHAKFAGSGIKITIVKSGAIEILLDDGRSPLLWSSGDGSIRPETNHHVVFNIDAQSKILTVVVDGDLYDGGERPYGYARFNPYMYDVNGEEVVSFSKEFKGKIETFRVYNRCLFTSEALGNYRSGE